MNDKENTSHHELHHEIFGSILDRSEMTPFLLMKSSGYKTALDQATKMMGNRGFDISEEDSALTSSEMARAMQYIDQAYRYCFEFLCPSIQGQLEKLEALESPGQESYSRCLESLSEIIKAIQNEEFRQIIFEDPRHIMLLASSKKFPHIFNGHKGKDWTVSDTWQKMACSILKVAYLIKSIEEDSQDINEYAQLGFFLELNGQNLNDLYNYDWDKPLHLPQDGSARRAYVKVATFFHKLKESISYSNEKDCLVFNSGDGVDVEIAEIKSRFKSPESMFTKLGKSVDGEVHDIRDVLAITFILKSSDDTLKLFHALQKRGVILQENTVSQSITQTLFDSPESMTEAVRRLMLSLARSEGSSLRPDREEIHLNAKSFYNALSINASKNPHSSMGHKKFQCKISYYVPIHRNAETGEILIPGTKSYAQRSGTTRKTRQSTLSLELRISDEESWRLSEQKDDSHHDAYKFRQLVSVMNRIFKGSFSLPKETTGQLREDQKKIFS